uniref:DUF3615 domain-containing protein n=1 Tax=Oryza meridionalis TaxID=40149 RepID=A0A0E0FD80_9ORYZ
MASSSSSQALDVPQPVCFFTEVLRLPRPGYHEDDITLCCIVQPSPTNIGSCHGCLANNHRIDHRKAGMHFVGKHNKMDGSGYEWDWPHTADVITDPRMKMTMKISLSTCILLGIRHIVWHSEMEQDMHAPAFIQASWIITRKVQQVNI